MGAHGHGVAAGAIATRALGGGLFAEPGRNQSQCQFVLAEPRRALQQPGMTALRQQSHELALRMHALTARAHALAGRAFSLDSTKQLGAILFDELKLRVVKKTPKALTRAFACHLD